MDIHDYLRILRKSWVLILALILLGIAAGSLVSILTTPSFQATTKVFISVQSGGTVSDLTQGSNFTQNQVKSYTDVVVTPAVLQPVIDELKLNTTAAELAKHVSATTSPDTVVVDIGVTDPSPEAAAAIANQVATSFEETVGALVPGGTGSASPVKITVLQDALVPLAPVTPNTALNIELGALVGLVVALVAAVLRQTLDTRVRNEHDVEQVAEAPILGGIIYDASTAEHPLVVHDDPRSPRAESFRTLRTNLQFLVTPESRRSFVITSSIPGEGKSTSTANLAIVTATAGSRVVLIDADLRKPRVAQYLGLEGGAGLTDVLVGRAELDEVLQPWGANGLFVLPAGRVPPNPSELLSSPAMIQLIETLEERFDFVLFDSPPLLPVTDAAILAKHTAGALLVVGASKVHRGQVRGSVAALKNVGSGVAGVIITMLPTRGPDSYGYGRYGYGYEYGYDDNTPTPKEARQARKSKLREAT
ncbi:chromosome partitioning protein [Subtercola boreus]|uniref:non-specific protein-tyrosine kinase n=1 Tax=Subtercola boreus TaxID=120213 RepID=A0A3E0VZJ6_9MICO|nr:polysaccharide biosynthesis tyrosine autokinase [Subtercola boreus]RFA15160.1 chromosome partitioning protein [Subtercola boreus]